MPRLLTGSSLVLLAALFVFHRSAVAEVRCDIDRAVIDGIAIPYDTPVVIVGKCIERNWQELSPADADIAAVRVNGRGNQDRIVFHVSGIDEASPAKTGQWYVVRGRLADGNALGPVTQLSMTVEKIEPIAPAPLVLGDFVDRQASFEGFAVAGGGLKIGAETLHVTEWAVGVVGKHVGVHGVVRKEDAGYRLEHPDWHLLDLADLAGKEVTLEGRFWSLNGVWWFGYREQSLVITDARDHPVQLDGDRHGSRARLTGMLVNQLRPSLDQISLKTDRDLVPTFVVRRAKIEYTEPVIDHYRRFREVYPKAYKVTDGVPELLPEGVIRRNIMGNETPAGDYLERNSEVIDAILVKATPKTLDVLAKRMDDPALNSALRLVYATMLAAANDPRGRIYLAGAAAVKNDDFTSALYCLGSFASLMPEESAVKTDPAWAEALLVKLMTERDAAGHYVSAGEAVKYSSIPDVLVRLDTPAAAKALVDYAVASVDPPTNFFRVNALRVFADSPMKVSHADLLRLESAIKKTADRRSVLHIALREKDAEAASLFFAELANHDNWFARDFQDHLTPEIVAALGEKMRGLPAEAQAPARRLVILGQKDPVPDLLKLLADPAWKDKSGALWDLAQTRDARAIGPAYEILHKGPGDFFHADETDRIFGSGVRGGIEAIAAPGTRESIHDLIELLDDDLARFNKSYVREGYRRIVAAHLIELTGESFGTDAGAWRKWNERKE